MKRLPARRTTVSLDKPRLSSPIFPSITHSHRTPSFTAPFPNTSDGTETCRSASVLLSSYYFCPSVICCCLSARTPALCHFLSSSSFPPLLAFLFSTALSSPSLTSSLSSSPFCPLHLVSLSSQQLLLCQNGAKFNTSVDGKKKALLCPSAPQLLFYLFISYNW